MGYGEQRFDSGRVLRKASTANAPFSEGGKQCSQLSALPASTAQRWCRRTVITYQMHTPWDQNQVLLDRRWAWLATVVRGKSHHWYSCIYLRFSSAGSGPSKEMCTVCLCRGVCWHVRGIWPVWNFCFCSDDSFNSIIYIFFLVVSIFVFLIRESSTPTKINVSKQI